MSQEFVLGVSFIVLLDSKIIIMCVQHGSNYNTYFIVVHTWFILSEANRQALQNIGFFSPLFFHDCFVLQFPIVVQAVRCVTCPAFMLKTAIY